jgi:hypothetical protein
VGDLTAVEIENTDLGLLVIGKHQAPPGDGMVMGKSASGERRERCSEGERQLRGSLHVIVLSGCAAWAIGHPES